MQHIEVKSSNLKSVGYDPETQELQIAFKPKKEGEEPRVYSYADVPYDAYRQLLNAPSVGSHFATVIKSRYQSHRIDNPKEKKDAKSEEEAKD